MPETKITAKKINENIDYLFSKIDWGRSWLDAAAITIMNNLRKDINALEEQSNAKSKKA
jgi:hypothetical protein